jgi:hypothetical protein
MSSDYVEVPIEQGSAGGQADLEASTRQDLYGFRHARVCQWFAASNEDDGLNASGNQLVRKTYEAFAAESCRLQQLSANALRAERVTERSWVQLDDNRSMCAIRPVA